MDDVQQHDTILEFHEWLITAIDQVAKLDDRAVRLAAAEEMKRNIQKYMAAQRERRRRDA